MIAPMYLSVGVKVVKQKRDVFASLPGGALSTHMPPTGRPPPSFLQDHFCPVLSSSFGLQYDLQEAQFLSFSKHAWPGIAQHGFSTWCPTGSVLQFSVGHAHVRAP